MGVINPGSMFPQAIPVYVSQLTSAETMREAQLRVFYKCDNLTRG